MGFGRLAGTALEYVLTYTKIPRFLHNTRNNNMNSLLKKKMESLGYHLTSIDLFSGPGGLATGFKWAGILPLIAVEWTDTTAKTYSYNHNTDVFELSKYILSKKSRNKEYLESFCIESDKSILIHGDINLVSNQLVTELLSKRFGIDSKSETIDIVSGGAPCESFSLAGTRTIGDDRDELFSNISRIAKAVKSKAILFENVKGLFSKKSKEGVKGAIFQYICDTFERGGQYQLMSRNPSTVLLTACDYGVPQVRERLFLVSLRKDIAKNKLFKYPIPTFGANRPHPIVTVRDAISDLPRVESGEEEKTYTFPNSFLSDNQEWYVKLMRGLPLPNMNSTTPGFLNDSFDSKTSMTIHKGPGHVKRKMELLKLIPPRSSMRAVYEKMEKDGSLAKVRHLFPNTIYGSRNRRLPEDQPSYTITSHCLDEMLHPILNRAITPREAARLQSFPDWYDFAGPYVQFHGSKEEDKYEQIGDAIPPLLAYALGVQFIKCLITK